MGGGISGMTPPTIQSNSRNHHCKLCNYGCNDPRQPGEGLFSRSSTGANQELAGPSAAWASPDFFGITILALRVNGAPRNSRMIFASLRSNRIRSAPWSFLGDVLKIALDTRRCSKTIPPLRAMTFSLCQGLSPKHKSNLGGIVTLSRPSPACPCLKLLSTTP